MVSLVHPENLERLEKQVHLVSQEFQDQREMRVLLDPKEALVYKDQEVNFNLTLVYQQYLKYLFFHKIY